MSLNSRAAPIEPAAEPEFEPEPEIELRLRELLDMLDYEIGRSWMSLPLRLKIEEIEILLGRRGTFVWVPPE